MRAPADLSNSELASRIRVAHRSRLAWADADNFASVLQPLMREAERRGVKLTVKLNRITINLREGGTVSEGPSREIDKHPLDVAAQLEEWGDERTA